MLVSAGIVSLELRGGKRALPLRHTLATGAFIAAYSVVDGMGVRVAGNAFAYTAWMCSFGAY